jgi:hypothetical protein
MKRVTYLGGSTIVGFGARRSAGLEANDDHGARRRKRKPRVKGIAAPRVATPSPLHIPSNTVRLLSSVMKDLGEPLPTRLKPLNRALRKLVADGVVSETGVINRSHPLLRRWLAQVDRRD